MNINEAFGPDVWLVRIDKNGKFHSDQMPVAIAIMELRDNFLNGIFWKRAWIEAGNVNLGDWDRSP